MDNFNSFRLIKRLNFVSVRFIWNLCTESAYSAFAEPVAWRVRAVWGVSGGYGNSIIT